MEDDTKATPIVYINCVDTLQYSLASHLSVEFRRKGISAFVNSKGTLDIIERASASVVVFSKDCLSSTSRLDKLVKVLQCQRKNGLVVIPVFYCISPSDVVILAHEFSCSVNQIRKWSTALKEIRELPGHQFREECNECEFVEEIVKDVYEKLFPMEQIGINSRLVEIEQLLCKQPWGIRRIGIWGMPGIGKTTLAKAVFDRISGRYEASCFIKHFDKAFHEKGFHRLLEEHFGKILKELPRACSSRTRPSLAGDRLSKKRTLVVLDDVQNPLVAESFLGGFHWFGLGSLVIITSRDKQVFRLCQINDVYEVKSLNEDEALQLFSQCASVKELKQQDLSKLSMEVIEYASGNPLALSFYGRELKGKKLSEMETTFLKLKLRTPYKIHDLFKNSYETLNESEKQIFLDIACFFNGENVDYVMQLLDECGFFPHVGIDVLVEKCLVSISENGNVNMHNLIQDFGREINNGETVQIERHRRLWEPWSIKFLLEDDKSKDIEDIETISLDTSNLLFDVNPGAFENMLNLRFMKIYCSSYKSHCGLRLTKGLKSLPSELRLLHWENYPLQSLPQDFDLGHLVELNMSYSQLQKLWGGTKNLKMLKIVKLCHSQQLTEIDGICEAKNIELIDLQGCTKLQRFPATGQLQHLRVVNLSGCTEIRSFPEVSSNIEELHLQGTGISELPISIVSLFKQAKLNRELSSLLTEFSGVSNALNDSLVKVVSANQQLGNLFFLNMKDCFHLQSLPQMVDLESLGVLDLSGCSELKGIQGFPRNLKELYLAGTAIKELPPLPSSIELLNAHGCVSLISIPSNFELLPKSYTFSNCMALSAQVVSEFVKNALTNVERIAREYQQQQELNNSLSFSFTVPSPASKNFTYILQPGSSVLIQIGSSWRNTLGFAIFVEVSFSDDYHEASGFIISCVCRWKDKEFVSHRLEKSFHCWTPGEGVLNDHMFVFGDLNMHPINCEGNDLSILADSVVFEFFTVNKQKKLLDESCTVTKCGVHVITATNGDTRSNITPPLSSSDCLRKILDDEVEEVLRVIYDGLEENDRNLFLYITCLFNDEEADFLAPVFASIGLEISSRLKVLADKSLIHISSYGIIVRHGLLQKIGKGVVQRESTLPGRSTVLDRDLGKVSMASSSSSLSCNWKYNIFKSFSEEDNCNDAISQLIAKLECKPMSTVKDKIERSKLVGPELVEAISESSCSIVVLSKNYAYSERCLDELVEIMNCEKELGQKVLPIFYDVVPSDVKQQIGDFGRAFEYTCVSKSEDEKQKWAQALAGIANIVIVNSRVWNNEANMIENLPHSFKMHSSMCLELKILVNRIMRIVPDIKDASPEWSSGMQILCMLNKALEKAKFLLQYCSESSKLYMAVTGNAILQRGSRVKNSLEQSLTEIRSMVPSFLAIKISQIVQDLRSTMLTLESSEKEAGKTIRELMRRSTSSSVSSNEVKEFYFAALKLQLSTPEATMIERGSLKLLLAKLGECEVNKRQILRYLICLLKKHDRIICKDHKDNSFPMQKSFNDFVSAGVTEAGCSEQRNVTLTEQFKCPLSLTVMYDPVIISSGHTFERMWIQEWFDEGNDSCPTSKRRLDDFTLKPNIAINNQISEWCSKHGLDVQDPARKYTNTKAFQNIDFTISSVASFGSSLYSISDLSCMSITDLNSSYSLDSPSYSKISKGGYFTPMQTIESESGTCTADSTVSEMELEPLCGLTSLPWDAQSKLIEDVRSHFERNTQAFRSMSPSRFLEPLITYLKNAHERNGAAGEIIKTGLNLLLTLLSVNRRAIEVLEDDVVKMLSVFLESEVVIAEEALNILEVISNHPNGLSKLTLSGSLSPLLKIVESQTEHLQEQAMITLKNLSSSNEICLEMVSLDFVQKLTSFLQQNFFSKHSIVILKNMCNTEKGRVCITETPGCLASIGELLDSNVSEEQENAISILLQLCVQEMEYCDLVAREGPDIYSSLLLISNNGTEEAKIGALELLRALEEVDLDREEEEQQIEEESSLRPEEEANASTTSQVVVTHEEPITVTTPSPKKSRKQMHSTACLELKNLVNRIMRIHHNLEDAVSEKITTQEVDESMIWDLGSDEGNEYLGAVNELRVLIDRLDGSSGLVGKTGTEELLSLRKAHDVLNMAMARLQDEFKHMLVKNRLPSELERVSFWSSEADSGVENGSMASISVPSTEDLILGSNSIRRNSGELVVDLINPDVISDLRNIADTMIASGYDQECIQAYTMVRKDALDEFLYNHEVEKLNIEDVLRMSWAALNSSIKKWVWVMKNIVQIYLLSEKSLDNQIFGDLNEIGLTCFVDTVKASIMQLLNFGEAVSLGPRQPEKLLSILEMYKLASELLPEINALFSDHPGSSVRIEYREVMRRLGECARATFLEFKTAIASDVSSHPFPGGSVHPLTNYVMNYLMALTDFSQTLDSLLMEHDGEDNLSISPLSDIINPEDEPSTYDYENSSSPEKYVAMTRHFYSITSVLEANLQEKSKLYKDISLRHIFLLNNIHYMTRKVLNSKLRHIFSEKWNLKHTEKFRQQATEYERTTWLPVLSFLKDNSSGSGSRNLKPGEQFQVFITAFENVYKTQTGWLIADESLREEVRTKASMLVIQAYWTFYSRHKNSVTEKYIKYSTDDLERLFLDLFAGSSKSLSNSYRR